jgi:para-nitrobenzyl esterase
LGIFGFLDFSPLNPQYSTNNGLRDVLVALEWVHAHISGFGGDPENITVVGQSAGATMVSALVTMKHARPFIAKAIMMSGGPTQLQSVETCRNTTMSFLENSGITSDEQLLEHSIDDLIGLQKQFIHSYGMGAATFRISRDGDLVSQLPITAACHGQVEVPMLIGTTREEMGFMAIKPLARLIDVQSIVQRGLAQEDPDILQELQQAYHRYYDQHRSIPMMYSDLLFRAASMWFAQAAAPHTNVWMYRFDFESRALRMNGIHAVHSSDIPYLFGNFTPVAVRSLFALDRDKSAILAVADELQHDVGEFMRSGNLPWDVCTDHSAIGKCYDDPPWYEPMIHEHIAEIYTRTAYYRNSLKGLPL